MNSDQYQMFQYEQQYEQQQIKRKVFRIYRHLQNQQSQPQLSQPQNFYPRDVASPIVINGGIVHLDVQNLCHNDYHQSDNFYPRDVPQPIVVNGGIVHLDVQNLQTRDVASPIVINGGIVHLNVQNLCHNDYHQSDNFYPRDVPQPIVVNGGIVHLDVQNLYHNDYHQSDHQSQPQKFNFKDTPLPISISGGRVYFNRNNFYFGGYPPSNERNVRSISAKPNFQKQRQNKSKQVSLNTRRSQKQIASSSAPKKIRQGPQNPKKSLKARKQVQNFQQRDQEDKHDLSKKKSKKKCFPSRKGLQKKNMNQFDISKEEIGLGSSKKFAVPISSIKKRSTNRDNQSARNQSNQLSKGIKEEQKNKKDVESSSILISLNQKAKTQSRYE